MSFTNYVIKNKDLYGKLKNDGSMIDYVYGPKPSQIWWHNLWTAPKSHIILDQLGSWKLVPDTLYLETPVPPSLIYGGIYLARLMVKIPEIIAKMRFSSKNAKKIVKYLEYLTEFISNQNDIFNESNYQ